MGGRQTNPDIAMARLANRETHQAPAPLGQTLAERTRQEAKRLRRRLTEVGEEEARLDQTRK